jgi:hypothetical protein
MASKRKNGEQVGMPSSMEIISGSLELPLRALFFLLHSG